MRSVSEPVQPTVRGTIDDILSDPIEAPTVTEDTPGRPPFAGLAKALDVRRNVAIGLGVGVVVAGLAFGYRVVVIGAEVGRGLSAAHFLALAFVLAITLGALVALALVAYRAVSLARSMDAE